MNVEMFIRACLFAPFSLTHCLLHLLRRANGDANRYYLKYLVNQRNNCSRTTGNWSVEHLNVYGHRLVTLASAPLILFFSLFYCACVSSFQQVYRIVCGLLVGADHVRAVFEIK